MCGRIKKKRAASEIGADRWCVASATIDADLVGHAMEEPPAQPEVRERKQQHERTTPAGGALYRELDAVSMEDLHEEEFSIGWEECGAADL